MHFSDIRKTLSRVILLMRNRALRRTFTLRRFAEVRPKKKFAGSRVAKEQTLIRAGCAQ